MASDAGPADVIGRVVHALEDAGIPYMLTGSLASAVHGVPRSTQDVDLVIAPNLSTLEKLIGHFAGDRYYVSRDAALQAYGSAGMFNVIDLETGWKIDFIILKSRDFSKEEFDRRRQADALGMRLFVASPEDVLVSKLEWAKLGSSERQIRDAAGIIQTQADDLDVDYVQSWVGRLGLDAQWAAAKAAANA